MNDKGEEKTETHQQESVSKSDAIIKKPTECREIETENSRFFRF
jgi:hypothetical protein